MTVFSCIYNGHVHHRRFAPRSHEFDFGLFMMYIDLDELPDLFHGTPLWSASRWAPARFLRRDYLGSPQQALALCVRELVETQTGSRPNGPIRMLTHLRYFGYCFNPVSIYYCFSEDGARVQTVVADVTNTPWGERFAYVLAAKAADGSGESLRFSLTKKFHVSPFMGMDMQYEWVFTPPRDSLTVQMTNYHGKQRIFDATLNLQRESISPRSLNIALLRHPFMTAKVITAIHLQAARLWWKRVPFHPHPSKTSSRQETRQP